jgi:N-acyl-D-aspartate/D-glutamate deacylase
MLLSVRERIERFRDRSSRAVLEAELQSLMVLMRGIAVTGVVSERNKEYLGRHVVDIAADEKKTFTDALLEIALEDDLETDFSMRNVVHSDVDIVSQILTHPLIQVCGSDAGAHVAQFSGNGDCPYVLEHFVRRHGKLTLEHAVKRMTSEVADAVAIKDRGVIAKGKFADLVIFDPQTITRGEEKMVHDLPDGGGRYMRHPSGIERVIVNGQTMVDRGKYTNARPGRIV